MDNRGDLGGVWGQSSLISISDVKEVSEKRSSDELEEKHEVARKRVKMRDLDDVVQSEEINSQQSKSLKRKDGEEMSQVTEMPLTLDLEASQVERTGKNTSQVVVDVSPGKLDDCITNTSACDTDASHKCAENSDKPSSLLRRHNGEPDNNYASTIRVDLDLNTEDVASSVNQDSFHPYKNLNHLKVRDVSKCGSSIGPLEVKDSMRLWKEMRKNGFLSSSQGGMSVQNGSLSSSHGGISLQSGIFSSSQGGIPPVPKQRGRKNKSDTQKKRMELSKRENIDRFTKIAAPSGLLNELNPGIINSVRNRKQVCCIIEAMVKSEKREQSQSRSKQSSYLKSRSNDIGNFKDMENTNDSGMHLLHSYGDEQPNTLCASSMQRCSVPLNKYYPSTSEDKSADGDSSMVDCEDDALALKLSSNKASENACSLSNEESTNFSCASSLSVKAASVASQWLELLHQDLKGRLSALHRSKERVRAVIGTELPLLISKEFCSGEENDSNVLNNCVDGFSNIATAHMHQERWKTLFRQMDKALTEEEKQLVGGKELRAYKFTQLILLSV